MSRVVTISEAVKTRDSVNIDAKVEVCWWRRWRRWPNKNAARWIIQPLTEHNQMRSARKAIYPTILNNENNFINNDRSKTTVDDRLLAVCNLLAEDWSDEWHSVIEDCADFLTCVVSVCVCQFISCTHNTVIHQ